MTDLCDLPAVELRRLIGRKDVSPVELVDACIARIERVDPAVNAVVALDRDGARAAARRVEEAVRGGPLGLDEAGLPFGVQGVGPCGGDGFLLAAAAAIGAHCERIPDLRRSCPDPAALAANPPIAERPGFKDVG